MILVVNSKEEHVNASPFLCPFMEFGMLMRSSDTIGLKLESQTIARLTALSPRDSRRSAGLA